MKNKSKQSSLEKQKEHFNSISEDYFNFRQEPSHLKFKDLLWGHFFNRNREKILKNNKTISVMEAMCGYCEGKKILEDKLTKDIKFSGFDYSEEMVKIAKELFPKDNIFQKDITKFNEKNKYDVVIVIGGFHHVYKYVDISLKNVSESLKQGGYLIVFEPTNNNKLIAKIRERIYEKNSFFDNDTEHDFKLQDFNSMLNSNGLVIKDQVYPGLLAYVLFYNPDAFKFLRHIKSENLVRFLFWLEKPLYTMTPGKKLSFCTLTLAKKK